MALYPEQTCPGLLLLQLCDKGISDKMPISVLKTLIMARKTAHEKRIAARSNQPMTWIATGQTLCRVLKTYKRFVDPSILNCVSLIGFEGDINVRDQAWLHEQGYCVCIEAKIDPTYVFLRGQ
jgi:hypothetical protein